MEQGEDRAMLLPKPKRHQQPLLGSFRASTALQNNLKGSKGLSPHNKQILGLNFLQSRLLEKLNCLRGRVLDQGHCCMLHAMKHFLKPRFAMVCNAPQRRILQ